MPLEARRFYRAQLRSELKRENRVVQIHAARLLGKLDLFYLCHNILGYRDLTEFTHRALAEHAEAPYLRSLAMSPRGSLKTTLGTIGVALQLLINDPDIAILICMNTEENAKKKIKELKDHIVKNQVFRELYPEIIPDTKSVRWGALEAEINRPTHKSESTVEAMGVGAAGASRHYDVHLFDDLVGEDECASPSEMQKVIDYFKLSTGLMVNPAKGRQRVTGNRWTYYDLDAHILENHPEFMVYHAAALQWQCKCGERILSGVAEPCRLCGSIEGEFVSYWPERFPLQVLEDIKKRQGSFFFSCQYLNNPLPEEGRKFKEAWLQYYATGDEPKFENGTYVVVDPAFKSAQNLGTGDEAAIAAVGFCQKWHWWVERVRHSKDWPMNDPARASLVGEIFDAVLTYRPRAVGIESYASQFAVLETELRREMTQRGVYFNIEPLPIDNRSKLDRIETYLQGPMSAGAVHFHESLKPDVDHLGVVYQILNLGAAKQVDCADVLAYAGHYARGNAEDLAKQQYSQSYFLRDKELWDTKREYKIIGVNLDIAEAEFERKHEKRQGFRFNHAVW